MTGRAAKHALLWALAASLLLHLLLLGSLKHFRPSWKRPSDRLPLDVRLAPPVKAAPPPVKIKHVVPKPHHRTRPKTKPHPRPKPTMPVPPPPQPAPKPAPKPPPPKAAAPTAPSPRVVPKTVASKPPPPAVPLHPAVRDLATDLTIRYAVQLGNGFVAGRAMYIWHCGRDKYSLVSTIEATGLAALFIHGRIVQVSEGKITHGGLQPQRYWLERSSGKRESARFDWAMNRLILSGGEAGHALEPQAQDLLSFAFQLAMTVRAGEPPFVLWVTDGRKFRSYDFRVVGQETLDLQGGPMKTLHVRGTRAGVGSLDVWLSLSDSGLPVRIRTQNDEGKTYVLRLEGITMRKPPRSGG